MKASTRLVGLSSVLVAVAAAAGTATAQPLPRLGFGLSVGGGVEGFTNDDLARTADTGGAWDVRAIIGTRSPIALEAAYQGSAQTIDAFGLDNSALLVGNSLEAAARFSAFAGMPASPYVAMGLGFRRYDVTRFDTNFSDVSEADSVVEVPLSVGVAVRMGGMYLDARAQFRAATGSGLVPDRDSQDDSHLAMHRWGLTGNLGYEF